MNVIILQGVVKMAPMENESGGLFTGITFMQSNEPAIIRVTFKYGKALELAEGLVEGTLVTVKGRLSSIKSEVGFKPNIFVDTLQIDNAGF